MAVVKKERTETLGAVDDLGTKVPEVVQPIKIPQLEIELIKVRLTGDSPLIMNKWSQKAIKAIQDKQGKEASKGREKRDPKKDYEDSMYVYPSGGYGFRASAFKLAACRAAKSTGAVMVDVKTAMHVIGEGDEQLVKINGKPSMRTDMVRLKGGGSTDVRYRGQFKKWSVDLLIRYNARVLSAAQIINFFNVAGFGVGVGEWRSERNGNYGSFHVHLGEEGAT